MDREKINELIAFRHDLHARPELSGKEKKTSETLLGYFEALEPDRIRQIGDTGLLITFKAKNPQKEVLIRSELDALPIQESNEFEYRSEINGVAHLCGHDGHMVMVAGLGEWCASNRQERTTVHLLYQPAEETGQGAREILEHPDFDIKPDYAFAIHNIPGYEAGEILLREHHFSASVISILIDLTGKTAHAGEPQNGINPALAVSELIRVFDKLNHNDPDDEQYFICTPVYIHLGDQAFGTSAGNAKLGFTLRCWDNDLMKKTREMIRDILIKTGKEHQLEVKHEWLEEFFANHNDPDSIKIIKESAKAMDLPARELEHPFTWGEDFGFFTSRFRGAMIGLGAGRNTPALHNPDYDFPDQIIEPGVQLYKQIIRNIDQQ